MRVLKQPFVFLQGDTKVYSFTQTVICFFTGKYKILQLHPNGHSFVFTAKCKTLKTSTKRLFMFLQLNTEF